jgi:tetratricopeptide (TPR) repeat protein
MRLVLFILFTLSTMMPPASANENLAEAFKNFRANNFTEALKYLDQVSGDQQTLLSKDFLKAVCLSRLEKYDEANLYFSSVLKEGHKPKDFFYEYGQSLYGANELEKAYRSFRLSSKSNFKVPESLYYMAHLKQILEDYKTAKDHYFELVKHPDTDRNLKQIGRYQLAETLILIADQTKNPSRNVERYALPQYKEAIKLDGKSALAEEIKRREVEVKRRYDLDPNFLVNGRLLPEKKLNVFVAQKISYDDNVILESDVANNASASKKDSYVFETQVFASYQLSFARRFVIIPSFYFGNTYYGDRETAAIYGNDSYTISPTLNNSFEHKLFGKPAAFLFDYKNTYSARDRLSTKEKIFASRENLFSIGEKFQLFPIGETTIKLIKKDLTSYTETLNSKTNSYFFSQFFHLPNSHVIIAAWTIDYIRVETTSENSDSNTLTLNYIIPNFAEKYSLQMLASYAMVDTLEQKETRGVEKILTLAPKIIKSISDNFKFSVGLNHSQKSSKDEENYSYSKNIWSTEFKYVF